MQTRKNHLFISIFTLSLSLSLASPETQISVDGPCDFLKIHYSRRGRCFGYFFKNYKMMVSNSSSENGDCVTNNVNSDSETQVVLNVYDLTPINDYSYWFGVGIFHSGIEVHGMEYGFGAHDYPASGVFEVEPKSCPGFIYRCSVPLGCITMPPSEFRTFIENTASEYYGDTYHLISKNCNHFTDDISVRLTGKQIPGWVNRLARLGAVCSCLLPESLQVTAVKQIPEYNVCSEEDGSETFSTTPPREPTESDEADQERHLLSPTSGEMTSIREVQKLTELFKGGAV